MVDNKSRDNIVWEQLFIEVKQNAQLRNPFEVEVKSHNGNTKDLAT